MINVRRAALRACGPLLALVALGGCYYRTQTTPAASPATTVVVRPLDPSQRVADYPEGQYELRGDGTSASPYYWVWVPKGTTVTTVPPLPR